MKITDAKEGVLNFIGRLGENESRGLRFFIGDILEEYPSAEITLFHQRQTDSAAYPVAAANCTMEGEHVTWAIQSADVAVAGIGECELVARDNGAIVKTEIYKTETDNALNESETVPDPWKGWSDDVLDAADRAEDAEEGAEAAADRAEAAADRAETAGLHGVQISGDDYMLESGAEEE